MENSEEKGKSSAGVMAQFDVIENIVYYYKMEVITCSQSGSLSCCGAI